MEPIEFKTERLYLRQWRPEDWESFARLNANPEVMRFYPSPLTREASDAMANRIHSLIQDRGWGFWAVEVPEIASFVGFVGLHIPVADLPFSPCVEIGWRLAAQHWGKGYATEAAKGALQVGFERLRLQEIVSFTSTTNRRSMAVMDRLGMKHLGETFDHPAIPLGNPLRPHVLYRLSKTQWSMGSLPGALGITMNLALRKAAPQDAETILRINLRSIFELCVPAYDASVLRQWVGARTAEYFAKSLSREQIYLAELNGEPVGFMDVLKGEILAVYVLPGFERRGIGSFLLSAAIRQALDAQQRVTVSASLNAVPFYAKYGFRSVKDMTYPRNGIDLPLVHMELSNEATPMECASQLPARSMVAQ